MNATECVIVCGVDGSPAGQRALHWAIDEAIRRYGKVRAVTAWSWDGVEALAAPGTSAEALGSARQLLDAEVDRAISGMETPPVIERVCERGVPSEALCAAAADAELLVLGSHGHGAVHDKLVGSTSERAIHHAPCPVVIIPDPRHVEKNLQQAEERRSRQQSEHPVQAL
jgi:nucleotide-binding universal stress UspA family protein